jgi:hypothetical protein
MDRLRKKSTSHDDSISEDFINQHKIPTDGSTTTLYSVASAKSTYTPGRFTFRAVAKEVARRKTVF